MTVSITDLRQTTEWASFLESLGWSVEEIDGQKIFIRRFPLIGSIAKFQRPNTLSDFRKLDEIAKKHKILFVKVEPSLEIDIEKLKHHDFEPDNWPFLPPKTIYIDLTKSLKEIFNNLSKNARYSIRKAKQRCRINTVSFSKPTNHYDTLVDYSEGDNSRELLLKSSPKLGHYDTAQYHSGLNKLRQFHCLLKKVGHKKHFFLPSWKELEEKVQAFAAKAILVSVSNSPDGIDTGRINDVMLAAALIFFSDDAAFYHYAASNEQGKKLLAPYLIIWEAIKLAKNQGAQIFDLEGIYDERYPQTTKNWERFTVFKKKFGGKIVEYPGVFVKYYNPVAGALFRINWFQN